MFWNYLIIAVRNLRKNRVYTLVNLLGLTIGLTVFLFGFFMVRYENSHDLFFANSDRIYTLGSLYTPTAGEDRIQTSTLFPALVPIIEANVPEIEKIARTLVFERVASHGDHSFYEGVTFADKTLLEIFDFDYLYGSDQALLEPRGLVLSEDTAIRYFGEADVIGEIITLDNKHDFYVRAVIRIPENSHFSSGFALGADSLKMLGTLDDLEGIGSFRGDQDWSRIWLGNFTYVLLPEELDANWLQNRLDGIFQQFVPDREKRRVSGVRVEPIERASLLLWDSYGVPVLKVIQFLCILVLITSCMNYTNLAVAQSLGRSREVGMRKVLGATRGQLLSQFIIESLMTVFVAVLCAMAILELVVPLFNLWSGSAMRLTYLVAIPWLLLVTLIVGIAAGAYPAWLATRASPVEALRDQARKGKTGMLFRSTMVGFQFAISIFMLATVMTMFLQNQRIEQASLIFPKTEVFTLHRLEAVNNRLSILQRELLTIEGVEAVSGSSQVPFEQTNHSFEASLTPGDEASKQRFNRINITPEFFDVYDIPLLAGRHLSEDIVNDRFYNELGERKMVNVIVNELALQRLGFNSIEESINQRIFPLADDLGIGDLIIVGVVPTQNIQGLVSAEKPWVFIWDTNSKNMDTASIRIKTDNVTDTLAQIDVVWKRVVPDRPMRGWFLDEGFYRNYRLLENVNKVVGILALVALLLTLIGIYGLAHFYSVQKTKEIGLRRVLGAAVIEIVWMLIWRFSKPLLCSLAVALPASFLTSHLYLNLFDDRIESPFFVVLGAAFILIILSWVTVASQTIRAAKANPVRALRYE